jgi:hypothetical protein
MFCDAEPEPGLIDDTANGGVGVTVGTRGLAASVEMPANISAATLREDPQTLPLRGET